MGVAVDPFNILDIFKSIYDVVNKFIKLLHTIKDNREDCKWLLDHISVVSEIVKELQQRLEDRTNIVDGNRHQTLSRALKRLEETLERGHKDIVACHRNGHVKRFINADDVAKKLRKIGDEISSNMMTAMFATSACTFRLTDEMHADVKKLVKAVHAMDTASIGSKLPSLSKQIVDAHPDLPPQMTEQEHIYSAAITNQNNDKREPNKTKVHSSEKPSIKNVDADRRASHATLSEATNLQRPMEHGETSGTRSSAKVSVEENNVLAEHRASRASLPGATNLQRPMEHGETSGTRSSANVSVEENNVLVEHRASRPSLPDGSASKSASKKSVSGQGGPSSIVNKACSSSSKLVGDEVQSSSVAVCLRPTGLQRPMERGETSGSKKVPSLTGRSSTNKTSSKPVEVVHPLELGFSTWQSEKESVQRAVMTLTNMMDSYVAVWIDPPKNGQFTCPRSTMVEPHYTLALSVTMKMHEGPRPPRPRDNSKHFEVRMIAVQTKEDVDTLQSASAGGKETMDNGKFEALVNKLHGKKFTETLTAISCEPPSCQIIPTIIDTKIKLASIDVHPAKTWVVTTTEERRCVIWDYQKKKKVMELPFKKACSAKFIVQKEWLAVGTRDGFIYIYSYEGIELREVHKFKRDDDANAINSLAVHPRELYILSSSDFSHRIMQWPLRDDEWTKKREIQVICTVGIHGLEYCPWNGDTFVAITDANTARIYTTGPSLNSATKLEGSSSANYYPTDSNQQLMVTCQNASSKCKIRNLETGKVVHTLEVSGRKIKQVACQTKPPILATSTFIENKDKGSTTLEDVIIGLWNANTYRHEETVRIPGMGRSHYMVFATDTNGLTRLFVIFGTKIAIVEVNLPVASTSGQTGDNG